MERVEGGRHQRKEGPGFALIGLPGLDQVGEARIARDLDLVAVGGIEVGHTPAQGRQLRENDGIRWVFNRRIKRIERHQHVRDKGRPVDRGALFGDAVDHAACEVCGGTEYGDGQAAHKLICARPQRRIGNQNLDCRSVRREPAVAALGRKLRNVPVAAVPTGKERVGGVDRLAAAREVDDILRAIETAGLDWLAQRVRGGARSFDVVAVDIDAVAQVPANTGSTSKANTQL